MWCNVSAKPGMLDLKGKAKWEAWNKKKGTSQEAAKQSYIDYANQLIAKYKQIYYYLWLCFYYNYKSKVMYFYDFLEALCYFIDK